MEIIHDSKQFIHDYHDHKGCCASMPNSDNTPCGVGRGRNLSKEFVCIRPDCHDESHNHSTRAPHNHSFHAPQDNHSCCTCHSENRDVGRTCRRDGSCCGVDDQEFDDHNHDHAHTEGQAYCSYKTGSAINFSSFDQDHGHGHNHEESGCCSHQGHQENSCCNEESGCCSITHATSHSNDKVSNAPKGNLTLEYKAVVDIENQGGELGLKSGPITHAVVCSSCDPTSPLMHAIQVTRLRLANLCCSAEERLIRNTLDKVTGIEHIAVNLVGKYVVIKHCPIQCCAPADVIVDMLNKLHLGVSLQDVGANETAELVPLCNWYEALHVSVVTISFLIGLGLYLSHHEKLYHASAWVFVSSIGVGLVPIVKAALISVLRGLLDIHLLMVIAVAGAISSQEYFDGSLVVTMFLIAEFIEAVVVAKVQRAVTLSNSSALPKKAYLTSGKVVLLPDLKIGDILAARAGEMIVADGIVTKGEGVVNESALTGESAPMPKKVSSPVFSGTVVQNGYLEIKVEKSVADSTMMQLSQAVSDVQADRGEYAKIIDVFAAYWTPFVLIATLLLITLGGGLTGDWKNYLNRGLVLLVLACPCAIVISAPIPCICAIANAAQSGVLIRGSTIIERMSTIDSIAVDKTGTLTKANFQLVDRLLFQDQLDFDPMALAAGVEAKSTHPLADAIVSAHCGCVAELAENGKLPAVRKLRVVDGVGLEAWVEHEEDWKFITIGNERLFRKYGGKIMLSAGDEAKAEEFRKKHTNKVVLFVVVEDDLVLSLALADELRPEAKDFVSEVQGMGLQVHMLTGDAEQVAQEICTALEIKHCHARLLPDQKLGLVDQMQLQGKKTLMIGDGINDSIALAASTVGVAMGAGGTAMAVAAADVVLLNDNLLLLPPAIRLCRFAKIIVLENFAFAIAIKIAAIVLAVLGILQFWEAVLIDIGTLLVVVINGTRSLHFSAKTKVA